MQVLDQILLRLTEPQEKREDAIVLGRLGFLEWLVSVPDDCDLNEEARLAHERAAPMRQAMPAIGVLCELLNEAREQPALTQQPAQRPSTSLTRRRGARRRRSLH